MEVFGDAPNKVAESSTSLPVITHKGVTQLLTLTKFSGLWQTRLRICFRGWAENTGQNQRCIYSNWHGRELIDNSSKAQLMNKQQLSMQPSLPAEYFSFQSLCCFNLVFLVTVSQLSNSLMKCLFQKQILEYKATFMQFTIFVYCKLHALKPITLLLNARLFVFKRQKIPKLLYSAQFQVLLHFIQLGQ